ncbi:hypothetical protein [Gluconacetobacter liquefaciens]|uniref:Uncharacterized protein n=2 Tax=Gluconacetobacter liquefaciens TaxID=89584 RepID=A0A370GAY9_GLULI|nr:hypothetical protein [Gluconacetobacter liquefaciens]MBB2184794.1 hypothetical protein [Gluconacetobacter liquefaciens]RDI40219.1 hypothetical protein C7453_1016 [Gluconacetobacter liquefaciens]
MKHTRFRDMILIVGLSSCTLAAASGTLGTHPGGPGSRPDGRHDVLIHQDGSIRQQGPIPASGPDSQTLMISNDNGGLDVNRSNNWQDESPVMFLHHHMTHPMDATNGSGSNALKAECDQSAMQTRQPYYCVNSIMIARGYAGWDNNSAGNFFAIRPSDALADGNGRRNLINGADIGVRDETGSEDGGGMLGMEVDLYADGKDVHQNRMVQMITIGGVKSEAGMTVNEGLEIAAGQNSFNFPVNISGKFNKAAFASWAATPACRDPNDLGTCAPGLWLGDNQRIVLDQGQDTYFGLNKKTVRLDWIVNNLMALSFDRNANAEIRQNLKVDGSSALDTGRITTDGDGNLIVASLRSGAVIATHESHFFYDTYTDPEVGIRRDAKFGSQGISSIGDIHTNGDMAARGDISATGYINIGTHRKRELLVRSVPDGTIAFCSDCRLNQLKGVFAVYHLDIRTWTDAMNNHLR